MKLVIVSGVPHWEDVGVRLPVIAGGDHIPGHIASGSGGESTIFTGEVSNPDGTPAGRIIIISAGENAGKLAIIAPDGSAKLFTGGSFITPFGEGITLSPDGRIISSRDLPLGGGGGGAAPAFSGTEAGLRLADELAAARAANDFKRARELELLIQKRTQEFDAAQAGLGREFTAEQNRLAQEAATRRDRLDALTRLITGFRSDQVSVFNSLANLQPDAFAFAGAAAGVPQMGITPTQGFKQAGQAFLEQSPIPEGFDPSAIASIEDAIAGLQGTTAPQAPSPSGFEHGGFVPLEGTVVSGGRAGTNKTARLVGEEGSVIAPGTEVMISGPEGTEIIPLGQGLAHGGALSGFLGAPPVNFDTETGVPGLAPAFSSLGFNFVPRLRAADEPSGNLGFRASGIGGAAGLQRLGIRPQIIRRPGEGLFFREGQNLRPLSFEQFQEFNFRPEQVLSFGEDRSFNAFLGNEGLTIGDPLTRAPKIDPSGGQFGSATGPFGGLIIEPTTGTALPDPRVVAAPLRQLAASKPFQFELLLQGYAAAGFPREAVIQRIQGASAGGTERTAVGLR